MFRILLWFEIVLKPISPNLSFFLVWVNMKQIRNNSAQESKLELWRWDDVNQSEQKLLVLGFYILVFDSANERVITGAVRQLTETLASDKWVDVLS